MTDLKKFEVWFVTGSQYLYGEETLEKVAANSRLIENSGRDLLLIAGGEQRSKLRWHRFVDAHLLASQDVDRWTENFAKASSAFAHAIQPRHSLERHRHGFHEPQPKCTW